MVSNNKKTFDEFLDEISKSDDNNTVPVSEVYIIDSPKSWWHALNSNWDNIINTILTYVYEYDEYRIDKNFLESLRDTKNSYTLCRVLNQAWGAAPDNRSIHTIPSWNILCDLCSEE